VRGVRVVELLGPPGSGKSALGERLARLDGCVVVKDHDRGDLPVLLRSALAAGPVLAHRPPPGVGHARWVAWGGRLVAADEVVRRRATKGARTVVLDQGPAYTLGRLTDLCTTRNGADWWHRQLHGCADLLDSLVLLDADRRTLLERLHTRPKDHAALGLDEHGAEDYLATAQHDCRVMASWLEFVGVPVVRLDTSRITADEGCATLRPLVTHQPTGRE
jgi:hypothetical protein